MTTLSGIDISNNNGSIDFKRAAPHVDLVLAKVTEGTGFVDRFFAEYVKGFHDQGVKYLGGYHFARPSRNQAIAEAQFYCKTVQASGVLGLLHMPKHADGKAVPRHWCDQEDPNVSSYQPLGRWTYAFCQEVEDILQEPCGVYLSPGWWASHNSDAPPELGKEDEWAATYGSHPSNVAPWKKWTIWQYTDKGTIPGISGGVDLDTEDLEAQIVSDPKLKNPSVPFRIAGSKEIYLSTGGHKDHIPSRQVFDALGLSMDQVVDVPANHALAVLPDLGR